MMNSADRTSADEAAAMWFARRDANALSRGQQAKFSQWLAAEPAHREAYERVERLWREVDGELHPKEASMFRSAALAAGPRSRSPLLAACAAVVLALTVSWAFWGKAPPASIEHYGTVGDAPTTVTLSDGSEVTLNRGSRLDVRYSNAQREVTLGSGQAFFRVAKNPKRPFSVDTPTRRITALGTEFEVRLDDEHLDVTLVEGRVVVEPEGGVSSSTERIELKPDETLRFAGFKTADKRHVDAGALTSWRRGVVSFDNQSLKEAAAEFNRYSRERVDVAPSVADFKVSGVFRIGETQRFARAVSEILPVEFSVDDQGNVHLAAAAARH
jgi:transmembrane sensor